MAKSNSALLPERLEIGPLVFSVSDSEDDYLRSIADSHNDTWGYINYGKGSIVLMHSQSAGHKRMALLHEVLHACWHLTDREHTSDEQAILSLAGPLLDALRRNPALVAFLLEE